MPLPDTSDFTTDYGAPYKDAHPVDDPETDVSADALNQLFADCAAMTRTAPRAWVKFTGATYTSGTMSISVADHDALWGDGNDVKPTVAQTSAGSYVITWPTSVTDRLGASHSTNIRKPSAPVAVFNGIGCHVQVHSFTANAITISCFLGDLATASSLNGVDIFVEWS
jgi:hypothetical protein